jgi:ATP-dependent RNA helicase DDX41
MQKRPRVRSPSPTYNLDNDDDSYEPYIPVAQRRQEKLAKLSTLGVNPNKNRAKEHTEELDEQEDALKEEEMRREMVRKERTLLIEAQEVHLKKAAEGESPFSLHHDPQFI